MSLIQILNKYNIYPEKNYSSSDWSVNITCPFPSHKNGQERTPSFGYHFLDDRFYCFGCQKAGHAVEFISYKKDIDKFKVAEEIISNFPKLEENIKYDTKNNKLEIQKILFEFSSYINKLIQKNKNIENNIIQIEKVLWWLNCYVSNKSSDLISFEDLEARIFKCKDLLIKYE